MKLIIEALVLFLRISINSQAEMPDFCMVAMNTSDCGESPIAVFTYYKPGSRCELELWRGCPTLNKFPDFTKCSHKCIGRQYQVDHSDESLVPIIGEHEPYAVGNKKKKLNPICVKELNTDACFDAASVVITYLPRENRCVNITWHGCPSLNKFQTVRECKQMCIPITEAVRQDDSFEKVEEKQKVHLEGTYHDKDYSDRENGTIQSTGIDYRATGSPDDENEEKAKGDDRGNGNYGKDDDDGNNDSKNEENDDVGATQAIQSNENNDEPKAQTKSMEANDVDAETGSTRSYDTVTTETVTHRVRKKTSKDVNDNESKDLKRDTETTETTKHTTHPLTTRSRHIKIKNLRTYSGRKHAFDEDSNRTKLNVQQGIL